MVNHTGNIAILFVVLCLLSVSQGYAISSQMDPVDRCIYTCVHCFKENNIEVICANECLATEGKMHQFWLKTCPELATPYFHLHGFEIDNSFNTNALDNNLKK